MRAGMALRYWNWMFCVLRCVDMAAGNLVALIGGYMRAGRGRFRMGPRMGAVNLGVHGNAFFDSGLWKPGRRSCLERDICKKKNV